MFLPPLSPPFLKRRGVIVGGDRDMVLTCPGITMNKVE